VVRYFAHEDNETIDLMLFKMLQNKNLTNDGRVLILPPLKAKQAYVVVNTEQEQRLH
jgi:hypothetical protein